MFNYLLFHSSWIFIIILCTDLHKAQDDVGPTNSAINFEDFLRKLDAEVYTHNNEKQNRENFEPIHSTTAKNIYLPRNENIISRGQKDVLQDVLMMKLVSYYEDKYKLSHQWTSTTPKYLTKTYGYDYQLTRRDTQNLNNLQSIGSHWQLFNGTELKALAGTTPSALNAIYQQCMPDFAKTPRRTQLSGFDTDNAIHLLNKAFASNVSWIVDP